MSMASISLEMKTSAYFKKALFYNDTGAIDDYFERKVGQLFEQSTERSYIDIHIQKIDPDAKQALKTDIESPAWDPRLEDDSSVDPLSPEERFRYWTEPSRYTGAFVIHKRISDAQSLTELAVVSKFQRRMRPED